MDQQTLADAAELQRAGRSPPRWAAGVGLPPVLGLSPDQLGALLFSLADHHAGEPTPLLDLVRLHARPQDLEAFALAVFKAWYDRGTRADQDWVIGALGLLGRDAAVAELARHIQHWPERRQGQAAKLGLKALAQIGSDVALQELTTISKKAKRAPIRQEAGEQIEELARRRGLTARQLAEQAVPRLGLDDSGSRVFSLGARSFRVVLGPDLSPGLIDEGGKERAELPKAGAKDDAELSAEAHAGWKLFKKQLKELAKQQAGRFEEAMASGVPWGVEEFRTNLLAHPLTGRLCRPLVWAGVDEKRHIVRLFRVNEEGDWLGADEMPVSREGLAGVALAHPARMSEGQVETWRRVVADHDLAPVVPQMGRPVYRLPEAERGRRLLAPSGEFRVAGIALVGALDRLGWTRGEGGGYAQAKFLWKAFPGAGATAVVWHEPGLPAVGFDREFPEQTVRGCAFIPLEGRFSESVFLPLGEVDVALLSEVAALLSALARREAGQ